MAVLSHILPVFALLFSPGVHSLPAAARDKLAAAAADLHTVYQYPLGTWVENIAVRPNGNLLVTFTQPSADLHQINPSHPPPQTNDTATTLAHRFANHTQVTGIAEYRPDVFAVIADNSVYSADFRNGTTLSVKPITTIPTAGLLNGMAHLPHTHTLFVSDSQLGLIWRVDSRSGAYAVHLQDATMAPSSGLALTLGINGLRYLDGYLYYVNSPKRLFCKVRVDEVTGHVVGEAEVIAQGALADDFNVRAEDGAPVAYLAGLNDNVVTRVTMGGEKEVVAGGLNSTDVAGATSGAFGRTEADADVLYVTTGGASAAPVNGTYVEGGKIVALKLAE
ncbi:hypothetical protein B0J12DRAFT_727514 [Macrophomina phaseolina]|uniref:Six-bladed beta-propeller TolB-like protein n=1 Tax=Macrophomina phaseolina TaxID=35725 RepID=A0ABQ8GE68_9PEZI|nr:hypothetical protein B0J12DRAFT_727514 [Macrophomina phaseolina]